VIWRLAAASGDICLQTCIKQHLPPASCPADQQPTRPLSAPEWSTSRHKVGNLVQHKLPMSPSRHRALPYACDRARTFANVRARSLRSSCPHDFVQLPPSYRPVTVQLPPNYRPATALLPPSCLPAGPQLSLSCLPAAPITAKLTHCLHLASPHCCLAVALCNKCLPVNVQAPAAGGQVTDTQSPATAELPPGDHAAAQAATPSYRRLPPFTIQLS